MLETLNPQANPFFEMFGNIEGGGLALACLAEAKAAVSVLVAGGALAIWIATAACHFDRRPVEKILRPFDEGMEAAAEFTLAGGKRGGAGHGFTTLLY